MARPTTFKVLSCIALRHGELGAPNNRKVVGVVNMGVNGFVLFGDNNPIFTTHPCANASKLHRGPRPRI